MSSSFDATVNSPCKGAYMLKLKSSHWHGYQALCEIISGVFMQPRKSSGYGQGIVVSRVTSSNSNTTMTYRVEELICVIPVEGQSPPIIGQLKFGEWATQVSFSSLCPWFRRLNINVTLFSYSMAFREVPRHFEPWSSGEDYT
ncbi:hypothetical protein TNCV_2345101 [Trichonephila clavipes]|nr:hypothetical protein TNCV_2345101 [Trichonephila clavipes]